MSRSAETGLAQHGGSSSCTEGDGILRPRSRSRRPYQRPRLEIYGRLTDLTRFGGSEIVDSGGGLGDQP